MDCVDSLSSIRYNPVILPQETGTASGDTDIQTMWQDMSVRHMEWVPMLWTATARRIAKPRVLAYRNYLARLKKEAVFSYQAFRELGIEG